MGPLSSQVNTGIIPILNSYELHISLHTPAVQVFRGAALKCHILSTENGTCGFHKAVLELAVKSSAALKNFFLKK